MKDKNPPIYGAKLPDETKLLARQLLYSLWPLWITLVVWVLLYIAGITGLASISRRCDLSEKHCDRLVESIRGDKKALTEKILGEDKSIWGSNAAISKFLNKKNFDAFRPLISTLCSDYECDDEAMPSCSALFCSPNVTELLSRPCESFVGGNGTTFCDSVGYVSSLIHLDLEVVNDPSAAFGDIPFYALWRGLGPFAIDACFGRQKKGGDSHGLVHEVLEQCKNLLLMQCTYTTDERLINLCVASLLPPKQSQYT